MVSSKSQPWKVEGKFDVSPYNFAQEVLDDYEFPPKLPICDSTIRKIDNTPGSLLPYSVEDKVEIASLLNEMGVAQLGCNPMHFYGTPRNDAICDGIRAIAKKGFKFKITAVVNWQAWVQGKWKEHADRILDMGVDIIDVESPGSENFRQMYLSQLSWEQIEEGLGKALDYVKSRGAGAGVCIADMVRGDVDHMISLMNSCISHGAERFYLTDSFGSLSPEGTRWLFKRFKSGLSKQVPLVHHAHDDFGLATAQSIAAAAAGAWPDASTNGIGERAYAKLEEVVLALELLYGVDTGIKLEKIGELCHLVERITGIKNQPHKPVVGETMYVPLFEDEYIELLKGGPYVSTSFAPEITGQKPALVWWEGMLSATTARAKLGQLELKYTDEQLNKVIEAIRAQLRSLKEFPAWIPDAEVSEICRRALG